MRMASTSLSDRKLETISTLAGSTRIIAPGKVSRCNWLGAAETPTRCPGAALILVILGAPFAGDLETDGPIAPRTFLRSVAKDWHFRHVEVARG